jgi:hypothetical protein
MATTLNNSGVVFPDNTTQTTAATGSPLTLLYSGNLSGTAALVNGVFSNTYQNYVVSIGGLPGSSNYASVLWAIQFYVDGGVASSGYQWTGNSGIGPNVTSNTLMQAAYPSNYASTDKNGVLFNVSGIISSPRGSFRTTVSGMSGAGYIFNGSGSNITGFYISYRYGTPPDMSTTGANYKVFTYGN